MFYTNYPHLQNKGRPDDFSLCFEDSYICWIICIISIILGIFYMALASNSPYTYRWLRPWFILTMVSSYLTLPILVYIQNCNSKLHSYINFTTEVSHFEGILLPPSVTAEVTGAMILLLSRKLILCLRNACIGHHPALY